MNRNLFATLDYGFSDKWGMSVVLPWIDRDHEHIHNHHGAKFPSRGASPTLVTCGCWAGTRRVSKIASNCG